jgi:hypothetical protein
MSSTSRRRDRHGLSRCAGSAPGAGRRCAAIGFATVAMFGTGGVDAVEVVDARMSSTPTPSETRSASIVDAGRACRGSPPARARLRDHDVRDHATLRAASAAGRRADGVVHPDAVERRGELHGRVAQHVVGAGATAWPVEQRAALRPAHRDAVGAVPQRIGGARSGRPARGRASCAPGCRWPRPAPGPAGRRFAASGCVFST